MNFARGLLNDPWIFFLDEPTLGLDVAAARSVRELVVDWRAAVPGRTILLTTHYMAEADELCDRIAIVDRGRILAIGTPDELKQRVQRESIFRLELDRLDGGTAALARLPGVVSAVPRPPRMPDPGERQTVAVNLVLVDDSALGTVVGALGEKGARILGLQVGADPRGRLRRARRARLRRRGGGLMSTPLDLVGRSGSDPWSASAWSRRQVLMTNLRSIRGRAYPRYRGLLREKSWILFEILLPFLDDVGLRLRLPRPPRARAVRRLRRPRRGDDRVLAQRDLDDGQPALLGEEPGQPRALLRRAHAHHGRSSSGWPSAGWS